MQRKGWMKGERGGGTTEGEEKAEEVQTGVRPLQGAGGQPEGWGSTEGRGGGWEGGRWQ